MNALQDGSVTLLAGRPGTGKTRLARKITENLTDVQGKRGRFFDLEGCDSGMNVYGIQTEIQDNPFDLVVVDFFQLLTKRKSALDVKAMKIHHVLAKERNIPFLILSSVSRQVEARENRIPQMRDILAAPRVMRYVDHFIFTYGYDCNPLKIGKRR